MWEAYVSLSPVLLRPGLPAFSEPKSGGKPLSKAFMLRKVQALIVRSGVRFVDMAGKPLVVRASSWRAGAVRSALDGNCSTPVIMAGGRWKSDRRLGLNTSCRTVAICPGDLRKSARAMWACSSTSGSPLSSGARVENFDPMVLSLDEDIVLASSFGASLNI